MERGWASSACVKRAEISGKQTCGRRTSYCNTPLVQSYCGRLGAPFWPPLPCLATKIALEHAAACCDMRLPLQQEKVDERTCWSSGACLVGPRLRPAVTSSFRPKLFVTQEGVQSLSSWTSQGEALSSRAFICLG